MRMMENKLCDSFEGSQMVAGMHGGGSPLMETITMMSRYDLEPLKDIAKYQAGFEGVKLPRYERATATPKAMLEKFEQAKKFAILVSTQPQPRPTLETGSRCSLPSIRSPSSSAASPVFFVTPVEAWERPTRTKRPR